MNNTIERNKINGQLLDGMHQIFEAGAHRANRRCGKNKQEKQTYTCKDGGYKCIHLAPEEFVGALGTALDHLDSPIVSSLKFIDIGCGVGEKVYLASLFGIDATGLELRRPLIDEGKALFKSMGVDFNRYDPDKQMGNHFIHGDALKFDYKDFDILYFFCPLCDHMKQTELERQIAMTAKVGAIVIPYLSHGCFMHNMKDNPPANFEQNWEVIHSIQWRPIWRRRA